MRKTISIAISGQLFHIEEQAYGTLDSYLTSVRSHFKSFEDSEEIVSDIELRIAERFTEKLGKRRTVINEADVADLIAHMGTVEDFKEFDQEAGPTPTRSTERKRLYRDSDDVMIAGVGSGIAKYFDIDPTIVRLLFVASLILGGTGILIYIVLWIVLPVASTTSQKLEMRGKSATIKQMEELIRENVPEVKKKMEKGWVRKIVRFPILVIRSVILALKKVFETIIPVVMRVIGLAILLISSVGIAALSFVAVMLFTNAWGAYMDIPIRELMGSRMYELLVVSGYFVVFFPLIVLILVGSSLMVMRNNFRMVPMLAMLGLWIVAVTSTGVLVAKDAPQLSTKIEEYVQAHKTEVQTTVELEDISSLEVHGGYNVHIQEGAAQEVFVTGSQRGWDAMELTVEGGELVVQKNPRDWFCIICLSDTMTINITVPELENISANGGSRITLDGIDVTGELMQTSGGARITGYNLSLADQAMLKATGGSRIMLEQITANALDISASGGSRITLNGTGSAMELNTSGGARLYAQDFAVSSANVSVSGGSRAEVRANTITGNVTGGGYLMYSENADVSGLEVEVSGSATSY